MNVFQNILYPYLRAPTRCSVFETDRPQVYLVDWDAPAGNERQLKRTGETGILRLDGSLNINRYAVPE
jgi:hypothetical protein